MSEGYTNTISGLQRKRDEVAREVDRLKNEIARHRSDLFAIERSLQAFGVFECSPTPKHYETLFERGEISRLVLRYLREHGSGTTRAIAVAGCQMKGYDDGDRFQLEKVQDKISRRLANYEDKGFAVRARENGRWVWRLAPSGPALLSTAETRQ
jgi:hypothetical protein